MNNYDRIEVYATSEEKQKIKEIAKERGMSVSSLMVLSVLNPEVLNDE